MIDDPDYLADIVAPVAMFATDCLSFRGITIGYECTWDNFRSTLNFLIQEEK